MRVLITGADGLLGSNLVRLLLQKEYIVRVFLFKSSKSKTLNGLAIERFYGDIMLPETIDEAMNGCDAVIHAAAMTNIWPARSEMVRRINIEGTQNIINAVLKNKICRMIYVGSASSVNAEKTDNSKHEFPGAKFGLDYIDSKFKALQLVLKAIKTHGLPAVAVLPTFMIGPYDSLPSSGQMILAVAKGRMKFYTGGGRNYIHVNDVATAITNALHTGTIGKYYIAGNENLSYKEFLSKTAILIKKPKPLLKIPNWLIKSIGYLGTVTGNLLNKQSMLSYPIARISCENQFVESEDAVNELKMPITNIEIAIKDCYTWFQANGYCQ